MLRWIWLKPVNWKRNYHYHHYQHHHHHIKAKRSEYMCICETNTEGKNGNGLTFLLDTVTIYFILEDFLRWFIHKNFVNSVLSIIVLSHLLPISRRISVNVSLTLWDNSCVPLTKQALSIFTKCILKKSKMLQ